MKLRTSSNNKSTGAPAAWKTRATDPVPGGVVFAALPNASTPLLPAS